MVRVKGSSRLRLKPTFRGSYHYTVVVTAFLV